MATSTELVKPVNRFSLLTSSDSHKAWHIAAVLLSMRRPATPIELAIRCTTFRATPELIKHLCSIASSPLYLTPSNFVTFSASGYLAAVEFFGSRNVNLEFLPRYRFAEGLGLESFVRKRKRMGAEDDEGLPEPKRRGASENFNSCRDNLVVMIQNDYAKTYFPRRNTQMMDDSLSVSACEELPKFGAKSDRREAPFISERIGVSDLSSSGCQVVSPDSLTCQSVLSPIQENGAPETHPLQKVDSYGTQKIPVLSIEAQMNEKVLEEHMEHLEKQADTVVDPSVTMAIDMNIVPSPDPEKGEEPHKNPAYYVSNTTSQEKGEEPHKNPAYYVSNTTSSDHIQPAETLAKSILYRREQQPPSIQSNFKTSKEADAALKQPESKREKKSTTSKQNIRYNVDLEVGLKEEHETADNFGKSSHDQVKQRVLPNFESFIVEEEEGSGGYGTVYRARRKSDGAPFAIKSPHANANRNHVLNELKMLERLGGKNFVIKYEGSIKSGDSDCIVLEHVEHDRPEVLKKEIVVGELQWYAFCMFRALAGLHRQGIVHRDVKPGNFLFNRKACKGFLIDFNLAMDLNQKYCYIGKTKEGHDLSHDHPSSSKPLPPSKSRKVLPSQDRKETHHAQKKVLKPLELSKDTRKKIGKYNPQAGSKSIMKSQGADGSGITSAKEATSTKTPSAEKFREPLPCQGRKELINLVQASFQGEKRESASVPVGRRKRIAASPAKVDQKFVYLTPMPLQSANGIIGGSGLPKSKGEGKVKKEGPCVGTKGFRAPEVLFRSLHQGPKVDVWSAGVTLLYLMIGRTPFVGDPDQNAKDIAKIRGSEELWEVAKLHNRESSFPAELFDSKFLPSTKLRDWCKQNTRKPDFFEAIPSSLFDLVDKCLTVNPRLRISAEEALRHEYFNSIHEALRKHRILRQGDSQTCR